MTVSPFLNELLMSSPFNLLEAAVLWHLTEQNNDGRNISVSYWLGSNLSGSAWFDTAFRGTSQYTFLKEDRKADQTVIHWRCLFYVENYYQAVKSFGKAGVSDPLGHEDFLYASSYLLNNNLLWLKCSWLLVSVISCSWKEKMHYICLFCWVCFSFY